MVVMMISLKYINRILEFGMILLWLVLIRDLVNLGILLSFIIIQILRYCDKKYNWNIREHYYSFIILAVYLNIFGDNFFRFYYYFPNYDKFLHFFVPLGFTFILANILKQKSLSILVMMGLNNILEIVEYLMDRLFKTTTQGVFIRTKHMMIVSPLTDTMIDLIIALLGSVCGYFIYKMYFSRKIF